MSKILVTGGAGNIGTNLCSELIKRGHNVIACDITNNERESFHRPLTFIISDICKCVH